MNFVESWKINRRGRDKGPNRPVAEGDAQEAANTRDEEALDQDLLNQLAATRAERAAERNLSTPRGGPREQQVRDIDAANQQHGANRRPQ